MSREVVSIPDGQYSAKVIDYGIWESKAGKAMVRVDLQVWYGNRNHQMAWFGGLEKDVAPGRKKSAREWTLEALQKLNPHLTINTLIDKNEKGLDSAEFIGADILVTIENGPDKDNKIVSRVRYLNSAKKFNRLKSSTLADLREPSDLFADDLPPF